MTKFQKAQWVFKSIVPKYGVEDMYRLYVARDSQALKNRYSGVQGINNVIHIVNKVEGVLKNQKIFDLIENMEYVVYALYSSI
jgi:hypothetical protein